jgi:hypothetical protein
MTPLKRAALSSLMALSLAGPALATPLSMPLATQQRLHLATASAVSIRQSETVSGYAKVLDPLPLASLDADLTSAVAVADASRAEAARAKSLNANGSAMSLRAVEAAQAQARVDAARVSLYRRQLAMQWGPIGALSDERRTGLINLLATGRAALVRIDSPSALGQGGLKSVEATFEGLGTAHVTILGPARIADMRLGSPGLMGQVTGPLAGRLAAGLTAPVGLTLPLKGSGVLIPRAALLRTGGQTWVYVKLRPTTFERRAVVIGQSTEAGMVASSGVAAGETLVVQGASKLLSAETAGTTPPDKDD